jgi:endonuclease G
MIQAYRRLLTIFCFSLFLHSCRKEVVSNEPLPVQPEVTAPSLAKSSAGFPETFESGVKTTFPAANITLTSGSWNLNDAIIGTSSSDRKTGTKSVRIQNTGTVTMNFDVTNGVSAVSISCGKFGTDANSTFELWMSVNGGAGWTKVGNTITVSSTSLASIRFLVSYQGNVRFQIRKMGGGRLNIDNFDVQEYVAPATMDNNLALGNPSGAQTNTATPNNYLMVKPEFALAYNNATGTPNWVSWHLSTAWKGPAARCDCFSPDNTLPTGFYRAVTTDYTNSGFDRGHICPSEDRDLSSSMNAVTFLMTNIMPQSPNLNRITWVNLEDYSRVLMNSGNELYIISGGSGIGGTGSNGGVTNSIAGGKIQVPAFYWKVIVVLPVGSNDVSRVTTSTRVIAVLMPNNQTVNSQTWGRYRVSVDALESRLGYNFLSNVPESVQAVIEAAADNGPTQ